MKNLTRKLRTSLVVVSVTVALLLTGSCDNEENLSPGKGTMTFSIGAKYSTSGGRVQEKAIPGSVIVSVVSADGATNQYVKLTLIAFGDSYVSENLELEAGSYRLTDFFVMSEDSHLLYLTPKEGAPLSSFVNDPLDIDFSISADGNTLVTPEVIGVEDAAQPGDFGYANFGFDIVKVTALVLPETTENIVKVSYVFTDQYMFDKHEGEVVPANSVVDLANPKLLQRYWRATIIVWTEAKECATDWSYSPYQKVYRLSTSMEFTGAAFYLPDLSDVRWEPLYYRASRGYEFFFSANPLKNYYVEVHTPDVFEENGGGCWMDRRYWNGSGSETCQLGEDAYVYTDMGGKSVGRFAMEDQPVCETSSLKIIDSYIVLNTDKGPVHEFFSWTLVDGKPVPTCDKPSSSGRIHSPAPRVPPTLKSDGNN